MTEKERLFDAVAAYLEAILNPVNGGHCEANALLCSMLPPVIAECQAAGFNNLPKQGLFEWVALRCCQKALEAEA